MSSFLINAAVILPSAFIGAFVLTSLGESRRWYAVPAGVFVVFAVLLVDGLALYLLKGSPA